MNKGLKVLSGVLALTVGLATAGMVGALSKGAQDILKVKEPTVPEYKFYEAITTKPEYSALLKKADKEYKGLKADSAEWARLSAMACNAAQGIESINNQLDAIPHFLALASDFGVSEAFTYAHLTEPSAMVDGKPIKAGEVEIVAFAAGLQLMTPEKQELDALVKENKALEKEYNKLEDKLDAYKVTGAGVISGNRFAGSLYETWKANFEAIQALAEKVSTPEYKEAAAYVANYTEEKANTMKAQLLKEKTDLNGLIAFVTKIANDNGLKLMDKCALPQDANVSEADKAAAGEAKKDTVPNTGAHR